MADRLQIEATARQAAASGASNQDVVRLVKAMANGSLTKDERLAIARTAIKAARGSSHGIPLIKASKVKRRKTNWLWDGRVPNKEATLLAMSPRATTTRICGWAQERLAAEGVAPGAAPRAASRHAKRARRWRRLTRNSIVAFPGRL